MADLFSKIRVSVKTNGKLSEPFKPMRGFPQGRPASPIQWSISYDGGVLDDLCRAGLCYRIDCGDLAIFIFADDTMFCVSQKASGVDNVVSLANSPRGNES